MKQITMIFLVLTGLFVAALCIAVPLGIAYSDVGDSRGSNSSNVNDSKSDVRPRLGRVDNADVFYIGQGYADRDA